MGNLFDELEQKTDMFVINVDEVKTKHVDFVSVSIGTIKSAIYIYFFIKS
jgi:hypothetical protein